MAVDLGSGVCFVDEANEGCVLARICEDLDYVDWGGGGSCGGLGDGGANKGDKGEEDEEGGWWCRHCVGSELIRVASVVVSGWVDLMNEWMDRA